MDTLLQKKIMRRIYYAFFIRTVTQPALLNGFLTLGLLIVLTYFISLGNIIHNALSVHAGGLVHFVTHAFLNTDIWTLIVLGAFILSAFSLRLTLSPMKQHSFHFVKI